MPGRWGESPFVALTCALALGILASSLVRSYWYPAILLSTLSLIFAAVAAFLKDRLVGALWLSLAATSGTGLVLAVAERDAHADADVRTLLEHSAVPLHQMVAFDGCVAVESTVRDQEFLFTLELRALRPGPEWVAARGGVWVRMPVLVSETESVPATVLRCGDRVRGWGQFDVRRNFQNPGYVDRKQFLTRRGIYLTARVKSPRVLEVLRGDCSGAWEAAAAAVRTRIRRTLNILSSAGKERQSAILASILIGDYSGLDRRTREAFQNSGTLHVLVVSGLHVGWIAWALVRLLRLLRVPEAVSRLTVAAAILLYTSVVGFQASISRSLWMFVLYLCGQVLFRRSSPVNIACASAFLLLAASPDWLFDVGFQLSFLAVLAISLLGIPLVNCLVRPVLDPLAHAGDNNRLFAQPGCLYRLGRSLRVRGELAAEYWQDRFRWPVESVLCRFLRFFAAVGSAIAAVSLISLSVQTWIEPVLAYNFNRLSWISAPANIVVVPLSSLVLSAGTIAVIAGGIPVVAPFLLQAAGWSADLLYRVTEFVAGLPYGWQRCPTPRGEYATAAVLLVFAWCIFRWKRRWVPVVGLGLFVGTLALGRAPKWYRQPDAFRPSRVVSLATETLELTFLDVGQGDSAVIRFPDGQIWMVDAGGIRDQHAEDDSSRALDIGELVVSRFLWHRWAPGLDRVVMSHPHQDHAGGIPAVLRNFGAGHLDHCGGCEDPFQAYVLQVAAGLGIPTTAASRGDMTHIAGVEVWTLHPPANTGYESGNESSIVLGLRYGKFRALLTGDLERAGERQLLSWRDDLQSQMLKVAHHGSRYATPDEVLERVGPRWAVVSAGRNNPFGNPARELLMRLLRHGTRPLLTMDHGAIRFSTDGHSYVLQSYVCGLLDAGRL